MYGTFLNPQSPIVPIMSDVRKRIDNSIVYFMTFMHTQREDNLFDIKVPFDDEKFCTLALICFNC